jgi:hypothetical protein
MSALQNSEVKQPPRAVIIACTLLGASFLLAVVRSVIAGGWDNPGERVLGVLILVALTSAVVFGLYRGVNWLRWLSIVLIALGLLLLPFSLGAIPGTTELLIHLSQGILQGGCAALLLLPSAAAWFQRRAQV